MKKIALIIISVFVGLITLYIVINLFDSKLNPKAYTLDDIRTKNYFYEFYSRLISYDIQEPYLWEGDPFKEFEASIKEKKRTFWWLRNPVGKILFEIAVLTTSPVISKSYRTRVYYEMTRILAELHMNYSTDKSVADILKELESYKTHDPCSGKPYAWDNRKKILYSIGKDRVNNGGVDNNLSATETDFAIPVVLKAEAF